MRLESGVILASKISGLKYRAAGQGAAALNSLGPVGRQLAGRTTHFYCIMPASILVSNAENTSARVSIYLEDGEIEL
jgi:hypothetical protein